MQVAHVFDAFGTLFDTAAAGPLHRAILGEATGQVVELWRRKQLEYTWLRSLMEAHADFTRVTEDALRYSLRASGVAATEEEVTALMGAYHELPCFPEVPEALAGLQASGARLAVLSNGDPALLARLLRHNGLADAFAAVLSAEEAGIYKPHRRVYQLVEERMRVPPGKTLFFTANAWDAAGAARFGFRVIWLTRSGLPPEELPGRVERSARDLREAIEYAGDEKK